MADQFELKASACLLLATAIFFAAVVQAQPVRGLQLSSVNAGIQLWAPSESASLDKLKLLAKNESDFTPLDLSDYRQGLFSINASSMEGFPFILPDDKVNTSKALKTMRFYGQLGFIPYSHKKEKYLDNRELMFGMYYQPFVYHNTAFLNRDTLQVDSIIGNYVYYTEWTPVLGITGDYIFKTDPAKRAGAYFGVGMGIGTALHAVILENYSIFSQTIVADTFANGINTVQYFKGITDTKNNIAASTSLLLELRFPFGGSLRIAEAFSIIANVEGKISKQVYLNGVSFSSRFGVAATVGLNYQL